VLRLKLAAPAPQVVQALKQKFGPAVKQKSRSRFLVQQGRGRVDVTIKATKRGCLFAAAPHVPVGLLVFGFLALLFAGKATRDLERRLGAFARGFDKASHGSRPVTAPR